MEITEKRLREIVNEILLNRKTSELQVGFDLRLGHNHDGMNSKGWSWSDWLPIYGGTGAMTYTSVTTTFFKFCRIGKMIHIIWNCIGITGGTENQAISFTLPVTSNAGSWNIRGACWGSDGATYTACAYQNLDNNTMLIYKTGVGNWGLGANRRIMGQCFYPIA